MAENVDIILFLLTLPAHLLELSVLLQYMRHTEANIYEGVGVAFVREWEFLIYDCFGYNFDILVGVFVYNYVNYATMGLNDGHNGYIGDD